MNDEGPGMRRPALHRQSWLVSSSAVPATMLTSTSSVASVSLWGGQTRLASKLPPIWSRRPAIRFAPPFGIEIPIDKDRMGFRPRSQEERPPRQAGRWTLASHPPEEAREACSFSERRSFSGTSNLRTPHAEARDLPMMDPYHAFWDRAAETLAAAWRLRGRRRANLKAAIALALSFDTHRTLTREHRLTDDQAITLMTRLAEGA